MEWSVCGAFLRSGASCSLDLRDIKVVCKLGGTVDDSSLVEGTVFDHKASKAAGGPTRVENAKIGLIQFCISPPKTDLENNVIISDYTQMDRSAAIPAENQNFGFQNLRRFYQCDKFVPPWWGGDLKGIRIISGRQSKSGDHEWFSTPWMASAGS